jgi:CDP-diacylglycerol--serine O-phosphatidyltransferase
VLFPLFLGLWLQQMGWETMAHAVRHPAFVGIVMVTVAALLVSTIPTWSFKNFKIPREYVLPLLLGTGLFVALLLAEPWAALAIAGVIYLGMIPFSVRSYLRLKREAESLLETVVVAETPAKPAA